MIGRRWEGRRIVLIPFLPDEIDLTYAWFDDPDYWRGAELKTPGGYSETMERRADDADWTIWSVMTRDAVEAWERSEKERDLIGCASLNDFRFGRLARNSYAYLRPEARGNGYGRELIALLCSYAFDFLAMEMVETTTMTENIAAQRALESVGYECTGKILRDDFLEGRWHDSPIYVLFRERFRNLALEGVMNLEQGPGPLQHADNSDEVQGDERLGQSFVVRRRKRAAQAKLRSTTHRRGNSTKSRLASGSLTTSNSRGEADRRAGPGYVRARLDCCVIDFVVPVVRGALTGVQSR